MLLSAFVAMFMSIVRCCQIAIEFDYALLYMTQISVFEKNCRRQ